MDVRVSRRVIDVIHRATATAMPREACGLLFGWDGVVTDATETANVASDPKRHFEIDPAALFAALRAERGGGPAILGWWHSHPSGDAKPSRTDAAMASPDGRLWFIASKEVICGWKAVTGGAVHGRFDAVVLHVD